MASSLQDHSIKCISLLLLTIQNAVHILVTRYVRTRGGDMFKASTAVIVAELIKLVCSLFMTWKEQGFRTRRWLQYLNANVIKQPLDSLKVAVPAVIYVIQNNLLYLALSNLDAATFVVTYQAKILTTALFSVVMLNKRLSRLQWISLTLLFLGVSIVQLQPKHDKLQDSPDANQNLGLGLIAVVISCFLSGFAGVYFEKILKGSTQSLWLRNVQLATFSVFFGCVTMVTNDWQEVKERGFFFGYDWVVWVGIFLTVCGGLIIALVVKYADNILKGFTTSAGILISSVASVYIFDFHISYQFLIGATMVIYAVYAYGKYPAGTVTAKTTKDNRKC